MKNDNKAYYILERMEALFPDGKSELENWSTPFQFLICVILSAQTTDKQVNRVTKALFENYPNAKALSEADVDDVMKLIGSINYYRVKSKHIVETSSVLVDRYDGTVPLKVEELMELPGVGRKTANVFLNDLYQSNEGIGADTHIIRVSQRLGLSKSTTPEGISADLEHIFKREDWHRVNSLFVLYGRYYCKARVDPAKSECVFKKDGVCSWCSGSGKL